MKSMDYEKFITREHIDEDSYNKKFTYVDNFLKTPNSNPKAFSYILNDPTTFSYMMFKIDDQPAKLYSYQDLIINDKHRFKYFRAANQIGKSILLDIQAARNLIIDHGHAHIEAIVSKSLPQSIFQMRRVKALLQTASIIDWKAEKGESDSLSVISYDIYETITNPETGKKTKKLKYTNLLICAPCTEGLLGYPLHQLNLDEFEYWETDQKYFFNQIALPRTYSTKGNISIYTNPNGQENFGAELEAQTDLNGNKKWHTYVFNYLDKPGNTREEYLELKKNLPRHQFESTVAAIRSLSDKNFFSPDEIEGSYDSGLNTWSMSGKQPFFFLDIGAKRDQACLVGGYVEPDKINPAFVHIYIPIIHLYPIGYPLTRVSGVKSDTNDSDGWHYEKSVKEYLEEYSTDGIVPIFGYDVTGNSGMKALFESMGIFGEDIDFSGPKKSGYYVRFKYFMEKRLVHRIKHKEWESQAGQLIATRSSRGYLLINSGSINAGQSVRSAIRDAQANKKIPDDCMDATAGFIHLCDNMDAVPASMKMF